MESYQGIKILDAVTLEQLYTLPRLPSCSLQGLVFSPDGRLLMEQAYRNPSYQYISWDLQTGGHISNVVVQQNPIWLTASASYSRCGTMLGVLNTGPESSCIYTYNILSGGCISTYKFDHHITTMIWAHSENPQYVVSGSKSITIWEVGSTPSYAPTKVDSLPTPDNLPHHFLLSPSLSQIAFTHYQRVLVWDTQHHKILLDSTDVQGATDMSFSSDDHFFACGTNGPEVYLWKQSPNGYLLHQKFISSTRFTGQAISPDGGSIVTFGEFMVHLWHIADFPTPLSDFPAPPSYFLTQGPQVTPGGFVLDFSPDKKSVAVRGKLGKGINVIDLKSGHLQLAIDTDVEVYAMRMLGSTITACCQGGKIITWDIPAGNHAINTRVDAQSNVQTTVSNHLVLYGSEVWMSISPDLSTIAILNYFLTTLHLHLYNTDTGKLFKVNGPNQILPFKPRHLLNLEYISPEYVGWCAPAGKKQQWWKITRDAESNITGLIDSQPTKVLHGRFPWVSSHHYQVMDDAWILSSNGRRLLWLPPNWRGSRGERKWSGRFLALLHGELPEAVILELEV